MPDAPDALQGNCRESSLQAGEQLFATAPRVDVWLVLEVSAPWGGKAFEESALPSLVKGWLSSTLDSIPYARLQFIRQSSQPSPDGIAFFVALSREDDPRLYRFRLMDYEDLLGLDIAALVAGRDRYEDYRITDRLYLVCTNGKRDRCCASYGLPVYQAFAAQVGGLSWQTTHTGGHRFAATGVCLPDGAVFGRLAQSEAADWIRAAQHGQIILERYRGRCCYDAPVQAADYFLREHLNLRALDGLRLLDAGSETETGEECWRVRFQTVDGRVYELVVRHELSTFEVYTSSADLQRAQVVQHRLLDMSSAPHS